MTEEFENIIDTVEEPIIEEPKASKGRIIKSIGYNQHVIIRDILDLHCNGGEVECDITYSVGNFYGNFKENLGNGEFREFTIEQPKYKFDVNPQVEGVVQIDPWGKIPLDDNSVSVMMVDLPFVVGPRDCDSMVNPKDGSCITAKRFSSYYPRYEMFESYEWWLKETYRVLKPDGVLIWKSQNVISGGLSLMTSYYSCKTAEEIGFYIKDEFVLTAKQRLIGRFKKQQHSRKYHSFFHVFVKNPVKRDKVGYYNRDWRGKTKRERELAQKNETES